MSYQVVDPQPAGLADEEKCVKLDGGQMVAVLLAAAPLPSNAGIAFYARARAIDATGRTLMHGEIPMITEARHTACHAEIEQKGSAAIGKALADAVLGQPQTVLDVHAEISNAWSIRHLLAASAAGARISAHAVLSN